MKNGDLVTFRTKGGVQTFALHSQVGEEALIFSPSEPNLILKCATSELDQESPMVKDSCQRSLEFCKSKGEYLDFEDTQKVASLRYYYIIEGWLPSKMKQSLANVLGTICMIQLQHDMSKVTQLLRDNEGILDGHNKMWFSNFSKLIFGEQRIASRKQRVALFNMGGWVLAQLEPQKVFSATIPQRSKL